MRFPNTKRDPYQKIARLYDTLFEPLNSGLRAIGLKMFPPRDGMAVLDVGCGTGVHLELYQRSGCRVFGIDQSPSMLQVARHKLGMSAGLCLGDASHLPYSDGEFHLIIVSTALHEMSPAVRTAVINESKRTLKEGGRLLLIDFHPGPIRRPKGWVYKVIITFAELCAGRRHFKNYRDFIAKKGLPALISVHGLAVDKEKIVSGGNIGLFLLRQD